MSEKIDYIAVARRIIDLEAQAVSGLTGILGPPFVRAVELILHCTGRVVVTGMGKAGHVARKVAATLASTGTPAFFLHPSEGVHGDLGMITRDDLTLAFSHQGQTEEVLRIIPYLRHLGTGLIAVTSNPESELARHADVALVLLEAHGFKPEDFALRHPGGSLGRRLLTKVADLMHTGTDNPVVHESTPLREAILTMTACKLAATSVVDGAGRLTGFFSDGDLRRYLTRGEVRMDRPIVQIMTRNPKFARPDMMAVTALEILREHKIIELPVCDESHRPIGMIHLHDITRAGIT